MTRNKLITFCYLFIVGIVQREGYRPLALVDIRLVALSLQGGNVQWTVGDGDAQALQRYRARLDASAPLRFPADADRFERGRVQRCDQRSRPPSTCRTWPVT